MIKSLTSLRGIFILFIFFHHCLDLYPGGGTLGVAFFFVLGGFGLTLGYKNRIMTSDFDYKHFLAKRLIKFYPLHWLCLIASIPFALLSFSHLFFLSLFLNGALLQTWVPLRQIYFSFNAVSWYLADTMFFAVVFPFLLKWIVCASIMVKVLIAMGFAAIYTLVAALIPNDMYHAILYISPYMRLTDFVLGIYLALAYLRLKELQIGFLKNISLREVFVFVLIALLVVESCVLPENIRMFAPVYWPIVALVIVVASLPSGSGGGYFVLENKWLQRLGELSFTLFLVHQLIIRYTKLAFVKILHFENDIIFVFLTLCLTLIVCILVDKYILNPITQWLTKRFQPSMTVRS